MRKVLLFHPGVQHSWQTASALQQLGALRYFATSLFYKPDAWPYWLERLPGPLGRRLAAEFRRVANPALDPARVRTAPTIELLERLAGRAGLPRLQIALDLWGNDRFGRLLARDIGSEADFALWGYNNSSEVAFAAGRARGRPCVLDRTNGDFRAYNAAMAALREDYGAWFLAHEAAVSERIIAREAREHALADRILVGSDFAARTVRDHAETPEIAAKVQVLEYCFDAHAFRDVPPPQPARRGEPVRFLFLGLAIPRKGIHHVLEAIAQLPASEASLTVVGKVGVPASMLAKYADRITYVPTVPRADVPGIMARHDVLLFPSYFEGAGIVLYEALAAGLGLIQSDRAALAVTPDTGELLGEISTEALLAAMRRVIADRDLLAHWRTSAPTAARRYDFAGYVERIARVVSDL
mgnify:CR=1 FL=1|jgi:glycosyltransferase involved in cell wall biosynthesis